MSKATARQAPPPVGLPRARPEPSGRPYVRRSNVGFKKGRKQSLLEGYFPPSTPVAERPPIGPETYDIVAEPGVVTVAARVRGRTRLLTPADIDLVDLYDLEEISRPTTWQAQRNFTGKFMIRNPRGDFHGWFWSRLELEHYRELEWEGYDEFNTQFLRVDWHWPDDTTEHHEVDAGMRRDGQFTLLDISAHKRLTDEKRRLFDLTAITCLAHGWNYEVGTDKGFSTVRRANLAYFATTASHAPVQRLWRAPVSFAGLVRGYGGGPEGYTKAVRALWQREYFIDMQEPLERASRLTDWPPASPREGWGAT